MLHRGQKFGHKINKLNVGGFRYKYTEKDDPPQLTMGQTISTSVGCKKHNLDLPT